LKDMARRT